MSIGLPIDITGFSDNFNRKQVDKMLSTLGLYRIQNWADIRPIILPDTGYPAE